METNETKSNGILVVGLKGRLDAQTSPDFQKRLLASIGAGEKQVALDCGNLEYISSAGLRVLLLASRDLRAAGGRIVLFSLPTHLKETFDLAGLSAMLALFDSKEQAIASFKGKAEG